MRMRKKKNLGPRMEQAGSRLCPTPHPSMWADIAPDKKLFVELGCGKGRFACDMAALHDETLYVAVERVPEAIVVGMERAEQAGLGNLRFIDGDISSLTAWFAAGSVDALFINFCDPWPRSRHAERRLTHTAFLKVYKTLLAPGGRLYFKTDNAPLYDYTLQCLEEAGYTVLFATRDLHGGSRPDSYPPVTTEYEDRFTAQGLPIHALEATP